MARWWAPDAPPSTYALSWLEGAGKRGGPYWQPEHVSVTNDRYSLIARNDGRRELYDWRNDRDELVNLADSVQFVSVRATLESLVRPVTRAWTRSDSVGRR